LLLDELDEALFFLLVEVALLGLVPDEDVESWASSPLP
jgi:hypothetical protein